MVHFTFSKACFLFAVHLDWIWRAPFHNNVFHTFYVPTCTLNRHEQMLILIALHLMRMVLTKYNRSSCLFVSMGKQIFSLQTMQISVVNESLCVNQRIQTGRDDVHTESSFTCYHFGMDDYEIFVFNSLISTSSMSPHLDKTIISGKSPWCVKIIWMKIKT